MANRKAIERKKGGYKPRQRKDSEVNPEDYDTVVLRNLDPSTDIGEIKNGLENIGYKVLSIRNAVSHSTRIPLPLFFIKLYKNPINVNIFKLKYLAHQVVIVEEYLQGPDLPRCTRCQSLDHLKDKCTKFPVCAWCSGGHYTTICKDVKISVPICSRCGGPHPSNYKGCKVYRQKSLMKALEEKKKNSDERQQNSLKLSTTSRAKIEEEKPVTSAGSTIISSNSTTFARSMTPVSTEGTFITSWTPSSSSSITTPNRSISSPNNSTTSSFSIHSTSSMITSPSSSTFSPCSTVPSPDNWTPFCSPFNFGSNLSALLSSTEIEKPKTDSPSGFSMPVRPKFDENAFKERLKNVADAFGNFSLFEDSFKKM